MEPFIIERIEKVKKYVDQLVNGELTDEESFIRVLKWNICSYYKIPFFHKYFDDRTLEDLLFESEMIKKTTESRGDQVKRASNMLQGASKEDIDAIVGKWEDEDIVVDDAQLQRDLEFMQSGEFKE